MKVKHLFENDHEREMLDYLADKMWEIKQELINLNNKALSALIEHPHHGDRLRKIHQEWRTASRSNDVDGHPFAFGFDCSLPMSRSALRDNNNRRRIDMMIPQSGATETGMEEAVADGSVTPLLVGILDREPTRDWRYRLAKNERRHQKLYFLQHDVAHAKNLVDELTKAQRKFVKTFNNRTDGSIHM